MIAPVEQNNYRVLQIITSLAIGGAERVVMDLSTGLTINGLCSDVVAINSDCRMLEQYSKVNFQVYSLGMKRNPFSFIKSTVVLLNLVRRTGVTHIHAHMFHALIFGLICKIVRPTLKLVFTSHSAKGFSKLRRLVIGATKSIRDADVIFVPGQHADMNASRTVIIPNGVLVQLDNESIHRDKKERRVFLFVGRFEPVKNPIGLVRAFAAMQHKDCELWMAGGGSMFHDTQKEIVSLGVQDRVRLLGIRKDLGQLFSQVDCLVLSSHWEGLPMAILEAGAVALPVVAPPVGALPSLLGDGCGYLAEVSNLHHVFDSVLDNYADATLRGQSLRKKIIKSFSLDHMCKAHNELYCALMDHN